MFPFMKLPYNWGFNPFMGLKISIISFSKLLSCILLVPIWVSNDSYGKMMIYNLYIRSGERIDECGQFVYLHLYYKTSISKGNN